MLQVSVATYVLAQPLKLHPHAILGTNTSQFNLTCELSLGFQHNPALKVSLAKRFIKASYHIEPLLQANYKSCLRD